MTRNKVIYAGRWAKDLLTAAGIDSLDAAFATGERVLEGRHEYKEVTRLTASQGVHGNELYIKRQHRSVRMLPKLRDLFEHGLFAGDPRKEWRGLNLLRSWGMCAVEPLALFYRSISFRSAIVTTSVPGDRSLREIALEGDLNKLTDLQLEPLTNAIVKTVNQIHERGYGWRGMDARHLYPEPSRDGGVRIWLIDCEGIHRSRSEATRNRDIDRLIRSLKKAEAPAVMIEQLKQKLGRP